MRYCVFSKTLSLDRVESECRRAGAQNMDVRPVVKQVFCEMTEDQADSLAKVPGLAVKPIRIIKPAQISVPVLEVEAAQVTEGLRLAYVFNEFRDAFTPSLTGVGLTVAVLDSGVRSTHESLKGKVIYEVNFSDSDTPDDVYGHGTSVAYLVAGGTQGSMNTGVATGASLMNVKCLGDEGEGTDEMLIDGIDDVCRLVELARRELRWPTDPMYPNLINISAGAEDDGDPDNPVRAACRTAVEDYGLQVVAAAGNFGPNPSTILIPAVDELVVAVGGLYSDRFEVWDESSRGPTKEGFTKPDFVVWATSIHAADKDSDTDYTVKSGTSFSAPILSGVIGLIWELGRRNFGEQWMVTWYEVEGVAEAVCTKPAGSPYTKDNSYGYGMPAVSAMIRGAQPTGIQGLDVMQFLPLILVFGMMGMVVKA